MTPLAAAAPLSLCRWCRCGGEATLPPSRPVESVDLLMPDSGGEDSDVEMGESDHEGPLENYLTEVVATSQGLLNTRDRDGIGAEEILKIAEVATKAAGVAVLQERATAAAKNACLLKHWRDENTRNVELTIRLQKQLDDMQQQFAALSTPAALEATTIAGLLGQMSTSDATKHSEEQGVLDELRRSLDRAEAAVRSQHLSEINAEKVVAKKLLGQLHRRGGPLGQMRSEVVDAAVDGWGRWMKMQTVEGVAAATAADGFARYSPAALTPEELATLCREHRYHTEPADPTGLGFVIGDDVPVASIAGMKARTSQPGTPKEKWVQVLHFR